MGSKLFIGSLSWGISEDALREAFEKAGTVTSVAIITDRETGRSKGFGFVEMSTPEESQAAIEMWNEQELDGRKVFVNEARPREER